MSNLYDCEAIEREVADLVMANDGELTPEIMQKVIEAHNDTEAKRLGMSHYMRGLELNIESHKQEEARIAAKRKSMESKLEWAKKYITPYVVKHGKQTMGTFTWSMRKSKQVVIDEWFDDNPEYSTTKTTTAPDKKKIAEALKAGKEIAGAKLVTNQNLQFK